MVLAQTLWPPTTDGRCGLAVNLQIMQTELTTEECSREFTLLFLPEQTPRYTLLAGKGSVQLEVLQFTGVHHRQLRHSLFTYDARWYDMLGECLQKFQGTGSCLRAVSPQVASACWCWRLGGFWTAIN